MIVQLSDRQDNLARAAGSAWRAAAVKDTRPEPRGTPHRRPLKRNDIEAARAQVAFAAGYGRCWVGCFYEHPKPSRPHVRGRRGQRVVIHSTPHPAGNLILKETWPDDYIVALVRGSKVTWEIVGWITAAAGRRLGAWHGEWRNPALVVDAADLEPAQGSPAPGEFCVCCAGGIRDAEECYADLGVHVHCLPWQVRAAWEQLRSAP